MFAVKTNGNYRLVQDGWPLVSDETLAAELTSPSVEQRFAAYVKATADGVSIWLDAYVQATYGYDSIVSAASYAGDKNPKFNAEGTAAKAWRSDCFVALYAAMPTYQAMPPEQWPTLNYVIANLPQPSAYQWTP